jgi:hypothetical protein
MLSLPGIESFPGIAGGGICLIECFLQAPKTVSVIIISASAKRHFPRIKGSKVNPHKDNLF